MSGKIIAVGNLKGGVGKSTLAVNLACALVGPKRRVELIDGDAQATTTEWAASGDLPVPVTAAPLEAEGERQIKAWIARALGSTADILLIDLPPHLSSVAGAALGIADLVVIPCGASAADISATAKTLQLVSEARQERKGQPAALLVPSRIDRRSSAGKGIEEALAEFKEPVASVIAARQPFADALGAGQWIGDYAPGSAAHTEIMALAETVRGMIQHGTKAKRR